MLTFSEAYDALDELMEALPAGIFKGLNGGVVLREGELHDVNGLIILGQYHNEPYGLGRYVTINYGSILCAFGNLPHCDFIKELRNVLHHELTHHIESLAGDRSLEKQDAIDVQRMLAGRWDS